MDAWMGVWLAGWMDEGTYLSIGLFIVSRCTDVPVTYVCMHACV